MEEIWIEKYRPSNLSEVVGQTPITSRLKNYVKERGVLLSLTAFDIFPRLAIWLEFILTPYST